MIEAARILSWKKPPRWFCSKCGEEVRHIGDMCKCPPTSYQLFCAELKEKKS